MEDLEQSVFDFIYKNVVLLNNISVSDGQSTNIIKYLIDKTCHDITIMTNRNKFPKDLKFLVVDLVTNAFEVIKSDSSTGTNTNESIKSMSENGRSVNFGTTDTWKTKYDLLVANQISTNEKLINKYKLLYKVRCPLDEQN